MVEVSGGSRGSWKYVVAEASSASARRESTSMIKDVRLVGERKSS